MPASADTSSLLRPVQHLNGSSSSSSKISSKRRILSSSPTGMAASKSSNNSFYSFSSSSSVLFLLLSLLAVASWLPATSMVEARSVALPSPQCHPAIVNTMRPRIRQICKALEAIWEFSDVMENYLDEKVMSPAERPMMNAGVKRKVEDVDHVFLRFGKRGGGF